MDRSRPPPHHARIAYHRAADRPGEVWSMRKRQWVPDTDPAYLRWKEHPWAKELNEATTEALAERIPRGRFRPPHQRANFRARELFAVLTAEDLGNVQIALDDETTHAKSEKAAGRSPQTPLRLLWASLQAQGDAPIDVTDARFQAGWAGLRQALTATRATEIATALNIREPA
jgi:hypothetical protein